MIRLAAVEEHRLVAVDQELVEGEAGGRGHLGDPGRHPIDARGDLADLRLHRLILRRR
jgi:hypothetical protein